MSLSHRFPVSQGTYEFEGNTMIIISTRHYVMARYYTHIAKIILSRLTTK